MSAIGFGIGFQFPRASASFAAAVAALSPVAWWRMASTADASGNGHALTLNGAPSQAAAGAITGDTDAATTLDGTQSASFADAADLRFTNGQAITIIAFVRPTGVVGDQTIIQKGRTVAAGVGNWCFRMEGAAIQFYYCGAASFHIRQGTVSLSAGAYSCVGVSYTYGGTAIAMYANGAALATTDGGSWDGTAPDANADGGMIGQEFTTEMFAGRIDEVMVFRGILTAAQHAAIAAFNNGA